MLGQSHERARQQLQRPARAALRRLGAGGRHQQGLLLARQLARRPRPRPLTQRFVQVALDEAAPGPVHRGRADRHGGGDRLVAVARIGGQQDLRPLDLAHGLPTAAGQGMQLAALGFAQVHAIAYSHPGLLDAQSPDNPKTAAMSQSQSDPRFTPKQGQYLAFIHAYTCINARPPAEADMQRFFGVTPPTIHQMVLTLERAGFIQRTPGAARSIKLIVPPESLPVLHRPEANSS